MLFVTYFSVPYITIPSPVVTRWNSVCITLDALVKLKKVITTAQRSYRNGDKLQQDIWQSLPDASMYMVYESLLPVLKAVKEHSEKFSGQKYPTISLIVPGLFKIIKTIEKVYLTFCNLYFKYL